MLRLVQYLIDQRINFDLCNNRNMKVITLKINLLPQSTLTQIINLAALDKRVVLIVEK
jgi:hypothetical protein